MFLYKLARVLQLIGLIVVPIAVAGNLAELAPAAQSLTLKESLLLAAAGCGIFYIGWALQQRVKPQ